MVHSKIAEVFANPSKQKIPAAKNHLQKAQARLALPRCSSTVFLPPQSCINTVFFTLFLVWGKKSNFFLATRVFFKYLLFHMILTGSSACVHVYECKIKGEKIAGKHVTVILSGMGLEIPQDNLRIT